MRWVFYGLLVINLLFFVWQQFAGRNELEGEQVNVAGASEVAPIRLLTELDEEGEVELEKKSAARKCDVYGPFFSAVDSRGFLRAVQKKGVQGRQEQEQVRLKPYFWVYVAPLSSRQKAQAMVNRLRGYQLNAELISDGRYRNGIALGHAETKQEIERLQQRLAGQDIVLKSVEKSRDYKQFWVVLDPGSEARIKGDLQDRLISDYPDIFHQQKVCKPVASGS